MQLFCYRISLHNIIIIIVISLHNTNLFVKLGTKVKAVKMYVQGDILVVAERVLQNFNT